MPELLTPLSTVKKVRDNIERFENLSVNGNDISRIQGPGVKKSPFLIIEEASKDVSESSELSQEVERVEVATSKTEAQSPIQTIKPHEQYDSTTLLERAYLHNQNLGPLVNDALHILKAQPTRDQLRAVLDYLRYGIEGKHDFNVRLPSPQAAQIVGALVNVTIPDHWHILSSTSAETTDIKSIKDITLCLSSVAGISALLVRLRELTAIKSDESRHRAAQDILAVLDRILRYPNILHSFLTDAQEHSSQVRGRLYWQETVSLLGGSKLLTSISAALNTWSKAELEGLEGVWLANGLQYSQWLAKNISVTLTTVEPSNTEFFSLIAQLVKRGLNLGHRVAFVSAIYHALLLGEKALWTPLQNLLQQMTPIDQKIFFDSMLLDATQKYANMAPDRSSGTAASAKVGALAALVAGIIKNNVTLEDYLLQWVVPTSGHTANISLEGRRALLANMAQSEGKLKTVLEKLLVSFGDKLQIQHNPIVAQQSMAQTIVLSVAYLKRLNPSYVREVTKSSLFLSAISKRLAASVPQARLLGIVIGTVVSRLVDDPSSTMNFELEGHEDEELSRYLALGDIIDTIGDLEVLKEQPQSAESRSLVVRSKRQQQLSTPKSKTNSTGTRALAIEEVADTGMDDLVPYAKPDDDPSDSDDDPTLINRDKPSAPVYIADLIKYLGSHDKMDQVELALKTAPSLIRRKTGFGTEVSANAMTLTTTLINLKEGDQPLILESLIACAVSAPSTVGPYLPAVYFDGDFSLAQRATLLSAIGLSTRELAGYTDHIPPSTSDTTSFPSSQLPPHLAAIYAPISSVAQSIEQSTLQPLAVAAADKVTGPDILKVRTFSTRLEVEKRNTQRAVSRSKRIPKDLHRLLTNCFYLPLCCRMSLVFSSQRTTSHSIFEPHIVRLFLQTLVVLISTLGPHAMQLATITRETLLLLTSLHSIAHLAYDPVVLPALLQLLLTTLDVNIEAGSSAEERLVTDFGTMLAELITWAGNIENMTAVPVAEGTGMQGMPWMVIVAGIKVKWHEVGRKFQGRMLGLTIGEMDMLEER